MRNASLTDPLKIALRGLLALLAISLLISCDTATEYRIITYNIRHGLGMDGILDLERTAQVIASYTPDVVILNEVDHGTGRSFQVMQADSLGTLLGMYSYKAPSIDYDGGEYGNAVLSRYPVSNLSIHDLSTSSQFEGRSVFRASIPLGTDTLVVLGTHLGLDSLERAEQVYNILALVNNESNVILGGDLNLEPSDGRYAILAGELNDLISSPTNTFPANAPSRRIDYLFGSPDILVKDVLAPTSALEAMASDHLPVGISFSFK